MHTIYTFGLDCATNAMGEEKLYGIIMKGKKKENKKSESKFSVINKKMPIDLAGHE